MKHTGFIALAAALLLAVPSPAYATDIDVSGYDTIDATGHSVGNQNIEFTIDTTKGTWTDSEGVTHSSDEYAVRIPTKAAFSSGVEEGTINAKSDVYTLYVQGFIPSTKKMIVKADTGVALSCKENGGTLTEHTYMADGDTETEYSDTNYRTITADELSKGEEVDGKYVIKGAAVKDRIVVQGTAKKGSYTGTVTYHVSCVDA